MGALADLNPLGARRLGEAASSAPKVLWQRFTVERDAGMQIERVVRDLDVVLGAQLVDPNLADVAPWSDEVAENVQRSGHCVHLGQVFSSGRCNLTRHCFCRLTG